MRAKQVVSFTVICMVLYWITPGKAQVPRQKAQVRLYNTAKQKLMEGKQIVGATVFSPDPNIYCAMANAGYDFLDRKSTRLNSSHKKASRMPSSA